MKNSQANRDAQRGATNQHGASFPSDGGRPVEHYTGPSPVLGGQGRNPHDLQRLGHSLIGLTFAACLYALWLLVGELAEQLGN